jgi:hypothetical protein
VITKDLTGEAADAFNVGSNAAPRIVTARVIVVANRLVTDTQYSGISLVYRRLRWKMNKGGTVVLVKTVAVLLLIGLALWVIFTVIGILAATLGSMLEFLVVAAIVAVVYHYFKHQNQKTSRS